MALLLQLTQRLSQGFSALWLRYPNKSAKKDAEKAYGQVVTSPEIDEAVHASLDWQIPHWESLEWYHPPYLSTYLRKGRYLDERPAPPKPKTPQLPAWQVAQMDQTMEQARKTREVHRLIAEGMPREQAFKTVFG